jgi:hypothetical protein
MAENHHSENVRRVLDHALQLAEQIGREIDAVQRQLLIVEALCAWRVAQRLKPFPGLRVEMS